MQVAGARHKSHLLPPLKIKVYVKIHHFAPLVAKMIVFFHCSNQSTAALLVQVLEKALKAKTLAENMLLKYYTNSEWTIIRPGGLMSDAATGTAILTESTKAAGVINRADVAALAVKALNSPSTVRKMLTAVDPAVKSEYASGEQLAAFEM